MTYGITHMHRRLDGSFEVADRPAVVMAEASAFDRTFIVTCHALNVAELLEQYHASTDLACYQQTNTMRVTNYDGASMAQGCPLSPDEVRIVALPAVHGYSPFREAIPFPWGPAYIHGGVVSPTYSIEGPWVWNQAQYTRFMVGGWALYGSYRSCSLHDGWMAVDTSMTCQDLPVALRWRGNDNNNNNNTEGEAMPEDNNTQTPTVEDEGNVVDCEWCGNTTDEDDAVYVGDGVDGYLCPSCSDEARYCVRCDTAGTSDTMIADLESSSWRRTVYYCEYCYDETQNERVDYAEIHSYSYKPSPLFYDDSASGVTFTRQATLNTLYMGVELELEYNECRDQRGVVDDMRACGERLGGAEFWYAKSDGSISNGFEAVTHPATLAAWRQADLGWLERANQAGCRAWNTTTCGLHIHLSLSAFDNRSHFARWWILHERNSEEWVRLAGRHSRTYASWDRAIDGQAVRRAYGVFPHDPYNSPFAPPMPDYHNDSRETIERKEFEREMFRKYRSNNKLALTGERNYERYTAINVQNTHTAEQRFWRPSLRANTLLATLEAVQAAFDYTQGLAALDSKVTMKEKIELLSWSDFRAWVGVHTADYPYLDARIAARFGEADEQADD